MPGATTVTTVSPRQRRLVRFPLTEAQAEALKQKLEKLSGKKISLSLKTDPSLLGGVRVELEGKELDGTVKGRLDGLSRKLDSLTL